MACGDQTVQVLHPNSPMQNFLVRDFDRPCGYREVPPQLGNLPRNGTESYVPWAVTRTGRVVYARTGEHTGFRGGGDGRGPELLPYDTMTSQRRRQLCESALGLIALQWPHFTRTAVKAVSDGVAFYLKRQVFESNGAVKGVVYKEIGHYLYTNGGKGFGRISTANKEAVGEQGVWDGVLEALANGPLEQQLAIHDAIGRKVLRKGDAESGDYEAWGGTVREKWFDNPDQRGRRETPAQKAKNVPASTTPGIVPRDTKGLGRVEQLRTRGVDMFERDPGRNRTPNSDAYYDDVDVRNLLFGAGISGTTGTLLQAARAFGKITGGERLRQYVMAIVGYLVGGGMHSYHETMAIAARVGVPYKPGAFLPSLPMSFHCCPQFGGWRETYYDIVVLGATHWRYNGGALPSHLNPALNQHPPRVQ